MHDPDRSSALGTPVQEIPNNVQPLGRTFFWVELQADHGVAGHNGRDIARVIHVCDALFWGCDLHLIGMYEIGMIARFDPIKNRVGGSNLPWSGVRAAAVNSENNSVRSGIGRSRVFAGRDRRVIKNSSAA